MSLLYIWRVVAASSSEALPTAPLVGFGLLAQSLRRLFKI